MAKPEITNEKGVKLVWKENALDARLTDVEGGICYNDGFVKKTYPGAERGRPAGAEDELEEIETTYGISDLQPSTIKQKEEQGFVGIYVPVKDGVTI
ncbi:MAG: hypothetical protein OEY94_04065 [Alphaproteobacteria bacterium]|nr:hypothetical protein [Alphaproteobacteria bacterium]